MRILSSTASSEHWLTLMTCTVCARTPDDSPVYKCNLGHTVCYPCFQRLVGAGIPVCSLCDSDKFTRHDVSPDFLRKLKTKPGIGRPRRYTLERTGLGGPMAKSAEESVTVEQLFQLPTCKIQQLFDETTKERIRNLNLDSATNVRSHLQLNLKSESRDEEVCTVYTLEDKDNSKVWLKKINRDSSSIYNLENVGGIQATQSRKPLKCPHDPCNKIIAVSSFQTHFKYEHCDFERFDAERGKELRLRFDAATIEHDKTICLGIIKLHEQPAGGDLQQAHGSSITKIARRFAGCRQELDTFWVMVSGSPDDRPDHAYAIVWLFSNNGQFYNCTVELSSSHDVMTVTTLCGVNAMHESQNIADITLRLNCLFLTHGTIRSMLAFGPQLKLRITIF